MGETHLIYGTSMFGRYGAVLHLTPLSLLMGGTTLCFISIHMGTSKVILLLFKNCTCPVFLLELHLILFCQLNQKKIIPREYLYKTADLSVVNTEDQSSGVESR